METVPPLPPISLSQHALDMSGVPAPRSLAKKKASLLRRASTRVRSMSIFGSHSRADAQEEANAQPSTPPSQRRLSAALSSPPSRRRNILKRGSFRVVHASASPASPSTSAFASPKVSILDTLVERAASSSSLKPPVPVGASLGRTVVRSSSSPTCNGLPVPPPLRCISSSGTGTGPGTPCSWRTASPTLHTGSTQWTGYDASEADGSGTDAYPSTTTLPMPSTPPAHSHTDVSTVPRGPLLMAGYPLGLDMDKTKSKSSSSSKLASLSPQTSMGSLSVPALDRTAVSNFSTSLGPKQMKPALKLDPARLSPSATPPAQPAARGSHARSPLPLHNSESVHDMYALPLLLAKRSLTAQDAPRSPAEETDLPPLAPHTPVRGSLISAVPLADTASLHSQAGECSSGLSRPLSATAPGFKSSQAADAEDSDEDDDDYTRARIQRNSRGWRASRFSAFDGNPISSRSSSSASCAEPETEHEATTYNGARARLLPPPDLMRSTGTVTTEDQRAIARAREESLQKLLGCVAQDRHAPTAQADWTCLFPTQLPPHYSSFEPEQPVVLRTPAKSPSGSAPSTPRSTTAPSTPRNTMVAGMTTDRRPYPAASRGGRGGAGLYVPTGLSRAASPAVSASSRSDTHSRGAHSACTAAHSHQHSSAHDTHARSPWSPTRGALGPPWSPRSPRTPASASGTASPRHRHAHSPKPSRVGGGSVGSAGSPTPVTLAPPSPAHTPHHHSHHSPSLHLSTSWTGSASAHSGRAAGPAPAPLPLRNTQHRPPPSPRPCGNPAASAAGLGGSSTDRINRWLNGVHAGSSAPALP